MLSEPLDLHSILLVSNLFLLFFILVMLTKVSSHIKSKAKKSEEKKKNIRDNHNNLISELRKQSKTLSSLLNLHALDAKLESEEPGHHKLFIGNVDYTASNEELTKLFSQYGEITQVNIPVNRYTGKTRGFAFVTFEDASSVNKALEMNGAEFKGRVIQVNLAKQRD